MEPAYKEKQREHVVNSSSQGMTSIMNYSSSSGCPGRIYQVHRRLDAKMDVVYSLLSMLGNTEGRDDMSATLLAMSNSIDSCLIMRESGCLPLLIQLIHTPVQDPKIRERASRALHNVVHAKSDEKSGRREIRVLRLLEQIRDYCHVLRMSLEAERPQDDLECHPGPTIAALMKLSFDEAHRHAMCQLGGLHAIAELVEMDHAAHESDTDDQSCITLRRYAGMALTNLTFGDGNNKALLCSFKEFMKAIISQLRSLSDDLRQVTASVLRNLSWRADSNSKKTLREVGAVSGLMKAAMEGRKESTLKSILSALWNLSAHCSTNKVDICEVTGALAFLVDMLSYKAPSKTLSIVENAGGILRNVSSHIAMREDYRAIIRERGCLQVLLKQLRSPSLTVVSNACGSLWNLSARCPHDQRLLWDLGAVPMLRSLVHSKHKMISMGSSAALKNLLAARPTGSNFIHLDSTTRGLGLSTLPSLMVRRQRALEQEIDQNLSETCENIEPSISPTSKDDKFSFKVETNATNVDKYAACENKQLMNYPPQMSRVPLSESKESVRSVTSTHSDTVFEIVHRHALRKSTPTEHQCQQQSSSLHSATGNLNSHTASDIRKGNSQLNTKYALCYKNAGVQDGLQMKLNMHGIENLRSTMSWATAADQELIEEQLLPCQSPKSSTDQLMAYSPINSESQDDPLRNCEDSEQDKPTNYSLHYTEQNLDEGATNTTYFRAHDPELLEDTVITYRTEGTPCESPLNLSERPSESNLQTDKFVTPSISQRRSRTIDETTTSNLYQCSEDQSKTQMDEEVIYDTSDEMIADDEEVDEELNVTDDVTLEEDMQKNGDMDAEYLSPTCHSDAADEDLLAACINIGMKNNRHRQSFQQNSSEDSFLQKESKLPRYEASSTSNHFKTNLIQRDTSQEFENFHKLESPSSEMNTICDTDRTNVHSIVESSSNDDDSMECTRLQDYRSPTKTVTVESSKKPYDSIARCEQVLLELCIKTGASNPEINQVNKSNIDTDSPDGLAACRNGDATHDFKSKPHDGDVSTSVEEYRRQRDPDAMIASLDRLTATLVQQTEAIRDRDFAGIKQNPNNDTWNDDSPHDLSFPTISITVPLVTSFDSEVTLPSNVIDPSKMTNSRIIEAEAFRLAKAVNTDFFRNNTAYDELETTKPPSAMNSLVSLTASYADSQDKITSASPPLTLIASRLVETYKRKNSASAIAKMALDQSHPSHTSLEYFLNDTVTDNTSQLENVKPPSIMDELLDTNDMENSMISVASIASEIADSKNSLFEIAKPSLDRNINDFLENINPPSLLNEISEIEDPTISENASITMCSKKELNTASEVLIPIFDKGTNSNGADDASLSLPTEYSSSSSVESTPKKNKHHLTPKEKRNLSKERYKTYTIAAGSLENKEEESHKKTQLEATQYFKRTPKQRRQENPARFQTQVLTNPVINQVVNHVNDVGRNGTSLKFTAPSVKSYHPGLKVSMTKKGSVGDRTVIRRDISSDSVQITMVEDDEAIYFETANGISKARNSPDGKILNIAVNNLEYETNDCLRAGNALQASATILADHQAIDSDEIEQSSETEEHLDCAQNITLSNDAENCQTEDNLTPERPKRAQIVIPKPSSHEANGDSNNSDKTIGKAIHGRRKLLYSSSNIRRTTSQPTSTGQADSSSGIPIVRSSTSPIVRATRATTLRQNTNSTVKDQMNTTPKTVPPNRKAMLSKRSSIPQRGLTINVAKTVKRYSTPPECTSTNSKQKTEVIKPLERQGTFTKDEIVIENGTGSHSPQNKSKIAKPVRSLSLKVHQTKSKISVKASSNINSCPESTQNTTMPFDQRCSSNSSILSEGSSASAVKSPKDAASKIATLWKQVEQSKTMQKIEKRDTRQWIIPTPAESKDTATTWAESNSQIYRSSTFVGAPITSPCSTASGMSTQHQDASSPKYQKPCDLNGVSPTVVSCRIPVRSPDVKSKDKSPANIHKTVVLKKQRSVDSTGIESAKRLSRLGSFIRVNAADEHKRDQTPMMCRNKSCI